jgi:two-component system nitrogen regulation sensor histidine kinase GlnL
VDQGGLALSLARIMHHDPASAVLMLDRRLQVCSHSANAPALLGLDPARLPGAGLDALPARLCDLVKSATSSGHTASGTEFFRRADNNASVRFTVLPLSGGDHEGQTAVLLQDISLAQQLEDDIRQLDRLASVGTLSAEMAHEVKNALVAVKTFVELLFEKNPGNELEGTVRREMKRIEDIVSEVLKFSRNATPTLQATSIHNVLERTLKMMRPQFEGRNVTIVTRFAATPDTVQGDENHLEQAFINLLLNAAEAMSGDGTLTLETDLVVGDSTAVTADGKRQLRIIIRDSGAGISSEHLSHMFEPFFTTKKTGTGLGLAITRRIIHEHHGLIRAESEPGKGAAFQIFLPVI